jgi:DNA repair protein RadC
MIMEHLTNNEGLSKAAEIEVVYKSTVKASERPVIKTSSDAVKILRFHWEEGKMELLEQFKVLFLNRANKVLCIYNVSSGGITSTVVDSRLIFGTALKINATAMILCHNHPSGNLKPSKADEELTHKIKEAGKFLDITILDHVIITSEGHLSFADEGLL